MASLLTYIRGGPSDQQGWAAETLDEGRYEWQHISNKMGNRLIYGCEESTRMGAAL